MHHFNVERGHVLLAPVSLDALLDVLLLAEGLSFLVVGNSEVGARPHVACVLLPILFVLSLAHAEHQHRLRVLQLLEVEDSDR